MTPRTQRPGYAAAGEYTCRRAYRDSAGAIESVCSQPVPEGELPHLAYNAPSGTYLVLCGDCREELDAEVQYWRSSSFGAARLLAALHTLPGGILVSEKRLRELLAQYAVRALNVPGPMTEQERAIAIDLAVRHMNPNQTTQ